MTTFHFLIGTFHTPEIYTFAFEVKPNSETSLRFLHRSAAIGAHSWLHISKDKKALYATAWTTPPTLVAYAINAPNDIKKINSVNIDTRSGYITASDRAIYSVGGANGEVFAVDPSTRGFSTSSATGSSDGLLQKLNFVEEKPQQDDGSVMDFGGLRHGAHSADLSPDGSAIYIADLGRNCIFTYNVDPSDGRLTFGDKHVFTKGQDGPRHSWPHQSGKHLYVLQEHSCMVDVLEIDKHAPSLKHVQAVRIIPKEENEKEFWADEVRTSLSNGEKPKYLYASTRGLKKGKKGYVAVFKLTEDGRIDDRSQDGGDHDGLLAMWETPTSGGWANAIQPGPTVDGVEYIAMTDEEAQCVFVLSWDGREFKETARAGLGGDHGPATAVWL